MNNTNNNQEINIKDLVLYLANRWFWFLLSIAVFTGAAYYKYAKTPYVYFRQATVIIKDPSNKTNTAGLDRYDNYINKVNVANEILQFRSKKLMRETVIRTRADVNYQTKIKFRWIELYTNSPINVTFPEAMRNNYVTFTVTPIDNKTVELTHLAGADDLQVHRVKVNDTITLHGQKVAIAPTRHYGESWYGEAIKVEKIPVEWVADRYRAAVGIRQEQDEASILKLALKDNNALRAQNILNTMVVVYNDIAVDDKNLMVQNTTDFINSRLEVIEKELGGVEDEIVSFKQENRIVDLGSAAGQYTSESQKYSSEVMETKTQLQVASEIGISQAQVSRLEKGALNRMKTKI